MFVFVFCFLMEPKNTDMQTLSDLQINSYIFIFQWHALILYIFFLPVYLLYYNYNVAHKTWIHDLTPTSQPVSEKCEASEKWGLASILFAVHFLSIRSYLISHTRPLNSSHFSSPSQEHWSKKKKKWKRKKSYPPVKTFLEAKLLWTCSLFPVCFLWSFGSLCSLN